MTTQRWTDEMLDGLATTVSEGFAELRQSVSELRDNVDGVRLAAQALLHPNIAGLCTRRNHAARPSLCCQSPGFGHGDGGGVGYDDQP